MAILNRCFPRAMRARGFPLTALLFVAGLLPGGAAPRAQSTPTSEYQVKAVFLYNFARFVEWPATAFADAQTPLVIGVLGDDPFGAYLDETVRGETVNGRPLIIKRYRQVEEVKDCHILFISRSEAGRLESILAALRERPILTVADGAGFARRGVMIRFVTENKRVRLRINLEAAKAGNLTLSSKLLRPAQIVTPGED